MFIRLLLALLMLTGPLPVGSCTCQASDAPRSETIESSIPASALHKAHRCNHHHSSDLSSGSSISSHDACEACSGGSHSTDSDRHQHDRDCPAVASRSVPQAVQGPVIDFSVTASLGISDWAGPVVAERVKASARHLHRPATVDVPLYLSLLSIRV